MAHIVLDRVSKRYPNGVEAVSNFSLEINAGELVVLVGPSGCGKSTLLRMIAGLEEISEGKLLISGVEMNKVPPKDRDIAMVFQNYALYPHMSVSDNIGFSLLIRKVAKHIIDERVRNVAQMLGLDEELKRKPSELSGGQRQRVAMGRALVRSPSVLLMDEPLSNLDAKLRVQMRSEILRIQRSASVSTIYVTHDQIEAMTMGDRVVVMRGGVVQECAPPGLLYENPSNLYVAGFIGSPPMNLFDATITNDGARMLVGSQQWEIQNASLLRRNLVKYRGNTLIIGVRPEGLTIDQRSHDERLTLKSEITMIESLGSECLVHAKIDAANTTVRRMTSDTLSEEEINKGDDKTNYSNIVAKVPTKNNLKIGQRISFYIDPNALYYFNPSDGKVIKEE